MSFLFTYAVGGALAGLFGAGIAAGSALAGAFGGGLLGVIAGTSLLYSGLGLLQWFIAKLGSQSRRLGALSPQRGTVIQDNYRARTVLGRYKITDPYLAAVRPRDDGWTCDYALVLCDLYMQPSYFR